MVNHFDYLQITIDILVGIHESNSEIKKMSKALHHMSSEKCKCSIANIIRYLMLERDKIEVEG